MILVVGSTGILGSEICRRLAAGGRSVRGLIRTTSAAEKVDYLHAIGVETAVGDLQDPASLQAACQGVQAVIVTAPLVYCLQAAEMLMDNAQGKNPQGHLDLIEAAGKAGVQHFILLSEPITPVDCPLNLARRSVEAALVNSGLTFTILQMAVFMETIFCPEFGFDYQHASAVIYGDGFKEISFISLLDAARFAVDSLVNPLARNAILQVSASQDYNLLEVVRIFEEVSGKAFQLTFVPAAALEAQLAVAQGLRQVSLITVMNALASGMQLDSSKARAGFKFHLTSVDEYARQAVSICEAR